MTNIAAKTSSTGNARIMLSERGVSFGYNILVSDMGTLLIMAEIGYPVVFEATTRSVQFPSSKGNSSGGQRQYAEPLARAALAVGATAVFIKTHEDPKNAPLDSPNMVPINHLPRTLLRLNAIDDVRKVF